jgi:hypothetical protein
LSTTYEAEIALIEGFLKEPVYRSPFIDEAALRTILELLKAQRGLCIPDLLRDVRNYRAALLDIEKDASAPFDAIARKALDMPFESESLTSRTGGFQSEGSTLQAEHTVGGSDSNTQSKEQEAPGFRKELTALVNRHSLENESDTPDFILADFLIRALQAFDQGVRSRTEWFREEEPQ